VRHFPYFI